MRILSRYLFLGAKTYLIFYKLWSVQDSLLCLAQAKQSVFLNAEHPFEMTTTRQSMKYLAHKAFWWERLGTHTGAVTLESTMSKPEALQPQHGGLRGAAVTQGAGPQGPQGT